MSQSEAKIRAEAELALRPRVLFVDDEPQILAALRDGLRRRFDVTTALGGEEGLRALSEEGQFAVVVSDFAMPGMNGAQFLSRVRQVAPDAVRVLLTGQAGFDGAVAAVNEGNIFRFLHKPCPRDLLTRALDDAVEHARARTAERQRLARELEAMTGHLVRAERLASLGTMTGAVGHEIKNVLVPLVTAVGLIREDAARGQPADGADLDALDQVRDHLSKHATSLLDLGRPSASADVSSDLCAAVRDTVGMLHAAGVLKGAEVDVVLPAAAVSAAIARTEVEQMLMNLVKNAVDALEECGRAKTKISLAVLPPDDGSLARLSIRDNGGGIPGDKLSAIFEPYYTTKTPDRGTGLGLFVIRQIVEKRGGKISVESNVGEGTAFSLDLPLAARI
jgi:signal transduction histidine kinase